MRAFNVFSLVSLLAISSTTHSQEAPPRPIPFYSAGRGDVVQTEPGQYIAERHADPAKYKNVRTAVPRGRLSILALRILRLSYEQGKGHHQIYLEANDQQFAELIPYVNELVDDYLRGMMATEAKICGPFLNAYSSHFQSVSLKEIEGAYENYLADYYANRDAGVAALLQNVKTNIGEDIANQLEFFMEKFSALGQAGTYVDNANMLMFIERDGTSAPYFSALCR